MTLLATITDADLGFPHTFPEVFTTRSAARAFLFDAEGNLAQLHNRVENLWKLPGGGVEAGETPEEALHREMREEAGCAIHQITYLGYVEEYRANEDGIGGFKQTSHLFIAQVLGPKQEPQFDEGERANDFALHWLTPAELRAKATPPTAEDPYKVAFMKAREHKLLTFLPE